MMSRAAIRGVLFSIGLCVLAAPAFAVTWLSGGSPGVAAGQTVNDDIMLAGQTVSVAGKVDGELFAAASDVSLPGEVTGSAWMAGSTVGVSGKVGGSARLAGSTVSFAGKAAKDLMVGASTFSADSGSSVGRDLLVLSATATINSPVGRNLYVAARQATLGSTVGGSAQVQAEQLTLLPGAVIRGDLRFTGGKLDLQPGAKVLGKVEKLAPPKKEHKRPLAGLGPMWSILTALALIVFGVILAGIFPRFVGEVAANIRRYFGASLGWGLLIAIIGGVCILIALVLTFTVILAPVMLSFLSTYWILVYAASVFAGAWLGQIILGWFGKRGESIVLNVLIGTIALGILFNIPWIGMLLWLVATFVGLGGTLLWLRNRGSALEAGAGPEFAAAGAVVSPPQGDLEGGATEQQPE